MNFNMEDRFNESLPSQSNFHTDYFENSNTIRGSRSSIDQFQRNRKSNVRQSNQRPESPPPPPPPLRQSTDAHGHNDPFKAPLTAPKRNPVEKPANGAFPFLKRGSRKEPTALHRINSPTNKGESSPTSEPARVEANAGSFKKTQSSKVINHGPAYDERNVTSKIQNHSTPSPNFRNSHRGFDDDGEEIVLMGNSYNKVNSPVKREPNNANSTAHNNTNRGSTVSINGDEWRRALQANDNRLQAHQEELDEFENIEMQIQSLKMSSTGRSELGTTARTAAPRSYSQDYSDDEDAAPVSASRMQQQQQLQLQQQSKGGSYLSNYEQRSFDAGDTATSGLAMLSQAAALRPAVHGSERDDTDNDDERFDHRRQQQQDDDEYDLDYDHEQDDEEYADPYTLQKQRASHRHSEFDKYDSNSAAQRHGATTTAVRPQAERFGDTASWGAVTQPIAVDSSITSFNSRQQQKEQQQPQSDRRASTGVQGKSVLAGSTLRKLQKDPSVGPPSSNSNRQSLASTARPSEDDELRVVRPVSSLHQTAPAPVRTKNSNSAAAAPPSGQKGGGGVAASAGRDASDMPREITEKARELESELETYRSENANLKKLRKQQEITLQEVISQKEEVIKWSVEEKAKVNAWCEQQRNALAREKRAAAKQASESRTASSTSIRKEKAEIEALQATIEKMKLDHEAASKKWRTNETRLNGLVKEHTLRLEEQSQILINLENDKLMLMEYISQQGLRVPKNLKSQLQESHHRTQKGSNTGAAAAGGTSKRSGYAPDGYVEEVEVQMVKSSSRTISASGANQHHQQQSLHRDSRDSSDANNDLANAVFQRGSNQSSKHQGLQHTVPGEVFNHLSNNIHAGSSHSRTMSSASHHRSSTQDSDEFMAQRSSRDPKGGRPSSAAGASSGTGRMAPDSSTNSWGVRSSRSSTSGGASRYDETNLEVTEDGLDEDDVGLAKYSTSNAYSSTFVGTGSSKKYSETNDAVRMSLTKEKTSPRPILSKERTMGGGASSADGAESGGGGANGNRVETILEDGSKMIHYRNGTKKKVSADGQSSVVMFANGDSKHTQENGLIVYYYSQADTTHTTFPDGTEVYEFPNGQIEKHLTSGVKQIEFPDKTRKVILTNGLQESYFPDGMILREYPDGHKEVITEEQASVFE